MVRICIFAYKLLHRCLQRAKLGGGAHGKGFIRRGLLGEAADAVGLVGPAGVDRRGNHRGNGGREDFRHGAVAADLVGGDVVRHRL